MRAVQVPLRNRSYTIHVDRRLLKTLGSRCAELKLGSRCAVISDSTVAPLYGEEARKSLERAGFEPAMVVIPEGEKAKSLKQAAAAYEQLAAHRLERNSFVVALGGGVVGDLAGFAAATYLRGIPFVQVPTTLLAQVDSSVGGKVGVNLPAGKNLVGAFHQPRLVLCDLSALKSLPEREFRAGLAEVIKYGVIYDRALFEQLEEKLAELLERRLDVLEDVIARCCEIKADVVGQDETESGLRAILNYGHTIGHALEAISRYGKYLHGEAISIGQVAASFLSDRVLGLAETDVQRIENLFVRAALPVRVRLKPSERDALFAAMRLDKKVSGGEIKFVLAREIGKVEWGIKVPEHEIQSVLDRIAA